MVRAQVYVPSLKTYLYFNTEYGPETDKELVKTFCSPRVWLRADTTDSPAERLKALSKLTRSVAGRARRTASTSKCGTRR